ncbi:MAG: TlpA family protein disulfide reductase [Bacteroidia bacterium]|nr:TlpA family protein disulfide reductase [Bacteroidia bacterium]
MRKLALIFCLIALKFNCLGQNQNISDSIINLLKLNTLSFSQINYNCRYLSKNIGSIDTNILDLNVKIKKNADNNQLTQNIVITTFNPKLPTREFKAFFDKSFCYYYSLDNVNKEGTFRKFYGEGKSVLGYFHSGVRFFIDSTIYNYFNSKISLVDYKGVEAFQDFITYKFEIQTADISPVKNYKTTFLFNVDDLMLVRILNTYNVNSENIYIDYQIKDYNFKNESIDSFFYTPKIIDYNIKYDTIEENNSIYPLLNQEVNDINGTNVHNLKEETILFKGKISVVYFWYMGCYGCMLSYPIIDSLYRQYSKNRNIQFIGLNPIDSNKRPIERILKYLSDYKILYRNYLIDNNTFDSFKERAMPLFLIIDENGIIKYQSVGYYNELYRDINIQLNNLLNN